MLAIDVRKLVKRYHDKSSGTKVAVDGIDLQVSLGEIFAILGPNGAGKTTTVEILEGYRERDSGEVLVLGADPATLHGEGERIWRNRIGIVLQSTNDGEDLSVEEMLRSFARLYANPKDVDSVISAVGLQEKRKSYVRSLSGGQRRRLDVALGIIGNPEILFLDEPTTGFDPEARRAFWALIKELRDSGTTILLTTHYLDEAEALADRVAVIAEGKIVALSTPETLGGRNTAEARIRWREDGELREHSTDHPTIFLKELSQRFTGEIPELTITRPTLEEIYLEMIGE